jgi:hypothetical protein
MPNRALRITTTTHAFAYATYGQQAGLGLLMVLGLARARSLEEFMFLPVFGIVMFVSGAVGFYAITAARKEGNPDAPLRLEMFAAYGMAVVNLLFSVTLLVMFGFERGFTAHVYVLAVGFGCILRIRQIRRDRRRLRAALEQLQIADNALAEPAEPDQQ